jgi:hypothetical protein
MESFQDFKMVKDLPIVEQTHEIHGIAKERELLKCALPEKFVVCCNIAVTDLSVRRGCSSCCYGFSSATPIQTLPGYHRTHLKTNLDFASLCLRRHHSILHLKHQRTQTNGREGLRNHSPL